MLSGSSRTMDGKNAPPSACMVCRFPKNSAAAALIPSRPLPSWKDWVTARPIKGCCFRSMPTCGPIRSRCSNTARRSKRRNILPGLCDGSLIGANGASEPNAGSDVFSMRTRVTKNGGDYILDGTKTFVTNAPVADLFAVYGTLDPKLGGMGICGFIIEKGTPGLSVGKKMDKMGLRTAPMAEIGPGELPDTGHGSAGTRRTWRRSFQLLDGLGTGLHSGDLPGNHAPPA